jgi:FkbM family methyltransferase
MENIVILIMLLILIILLILLINYKNNEYFVDNKFNIKKYGITGIIQIGAHKGEEARKHYKLVGENMIWVEAQPNLINELKKNVSKYNHKTIQALLWKKSGIIKPFNITYNGVSSSLLKPNENILDHGKKVSIKNTIYLETTTYTDLIKKYKEMTQNIYNFLILDCQGAEYEILLGIGSKNILQFKLIEVEISNHERYKNQKQQPLISKLLKTWGYNCIHNCNNKTRHGIAYYLLNTYKKNQL